MLTADHSGFVKYWQSNMNNVKMFQAHRDPVRGLRCDMMFCVAATSAVLLKSDFFSPATFDIQACSLVFRRLMILRCCLTILFCSYIAAVTLDVMLVMMTVVNVNFVFKSLTAVDITARHFSLCLCHVVVESLSNKSCLVSHKKKIKVCPTLQIDSKTFLMVALTSV